MKLRNRKVVIGAAIVGVALLALPLVPSVRRYMRMKQT